ncbi:HlyD family secretion protein [Zhongshania guokunii]|uniref:HlyD family secretion protein n=1 Tax=Zhongshania guokunii TaxID=641783 RepID=A0ABV3U9R8_9GAMM
MSNQHNIDVSAASNAEYEAKAIQRTRLRRRLFLLVPVVVVCLGAYIFVVGGRYISTENAYIKADVVNVGAEISGNIALIQVKENQVVNAGDVLLQINSQVFEAELHDAQAELEQAYMQIASLRATYVQKQAALAAAQDDLDFAIKQQRRIEDLHNKGVASGVSLDQVQRDLSVARNTVNKLESERAETLAKLGGRFDIDQQRHPEVLAAAAKVEKAQLNLEHCILRAPIDGVVSKVPQRGQYAMPGLPIISVVANTNTWIEANFKEDQLAKLAPGSKVEVEIDAYPNERWTATVHSISPATGAEFALLPPQNATGNWVKIVQRLPVRLTIHHHENESVLRAGLSANVHVDTGVPPRLQKLLSMLGAKQSAAHPKTDAAVVASHL